VVVVADRPVVVAEVAEAAAGNGRHTHS